MRSERTVCGAEWPRGRAEAGSTVRSVALCLVILFAVGGSLFFLFGAVIPPGFFGVRQITLGPGQGFGDRGLQPGLHLSVPFYSTVHLVPSTVQVLEFHRSQSPPQVEHSEIEEPNQGEVPRGGGLEIRTSDGLSVDLDVTVLTRFYVSPAENRGGPGELFTRVGPEPSAWDRQIRQVAADELRQSLGALLARQFYEAPNGRAEALSAALERMRQRLDPFGIRVEAVLLRRYTYNDDQFDEAIFNKNIQEQEERLKDAAGKQSEVKALLEKEEAEWDARVETLRVKGENAAQVMRSEAALYENQKKAEGDLAVAKAQAEVDRLKAGALAASQGAAVYVAREMAPLLSSLRGGVVANIDPYNIEEWAERLGVGRLGVGSLGVGRSDAGAAVAPEQKKPPRTLPQGTAAQRSLALEITPPAAGGGDSASPQRGSAAPEGN